jgi:hypothetical protein
VQLIQQWPDDLHRGHDELLVDAWRRFAAGDFDGAARQFEAAYRLILRAQPSGSRYHKGEALHNWGLALLWGGERQRGLEETLAAFVEDAASLAEEDRRPQELDRPAAHNLVYVFGLAGPPLAQFAAQVRGFISSGRLLPDPHVLLETPSAKRAATGPPGAPPRDVGSFLAPPQRRVFIGGWYGRLSTLRELGEHLDVIGYDGAIVADFGVPAGWGEDEIELAVLTNCHYAVFDVTESAGQIEEIADVPETMRSPTRVMAVFDVRDRPKPGISRGQTLVKLARWGVSPVGYADAVELKTLVEAWLMSLRGAT